MPAIILSAVFPRVPLSFLDPPGSPTFCVQPVFLSLNNLVGARALLTCLRTLLCIYRKVLVFKCEEVSCLDRGSLSGCGLCPSRCSTVLLLIPYPGVGSSLFRSVLAFLGCGELLSLIRVTGQFLKGLTDVLGN